MLYAFQILVDIDDNEIRHRFPTSLIRLSVREDAPVSTVIFAASADAIVPAGRASVISQSAAALSYSILRVNQSSSLDQHQFFDIDRTTGRIRLRRRLDRESNPVHRFTVIVENLQLTTSSASATLDVEVDVADANDNCPTFERPFYACRLPLPRTAATSTNVDQNVDRVSTSSPSNRCAVRATDRDQGPAARIRYYFDTDAVDDEEEQSYLDLFDVNSVTGEIRWSNSPADGDIRCPPNAYRLRVVAADDGDPPCRSATAAVVTVTVVGDDGPCRLRFDDDGETVRLSVGENLASYSRVGQVHAATMSGSRSRTSIGYVGRRTVRYSMTTEGGGGDESEMMARAGIVMERFVVDAKTGEIFTRVPLDREEREQYSFRVTASYDIDSVYTAGLLLLHKALTA